MESIRRTLAAALLVIALVTPAPAGAQYAEILRPLPVPVSRFFDHASFGGFTAATQIGRRLFLAGPFTRLAEPTGGAVVTTVLGTRVPGAFPFFDGTVSQILPDGTGGWLVVGDFRSVNGEPSSGFARVNADRTVDARFRVIADAAIMRLAIAHGRVYLAGAFTAINGVRRRGLAAFDAATGQLTSWGAGFDGRGAVRELAASSIAVYVSGGDGGGRLWGLEAGTGRVLFDRPGFVSAIAAASDRVYLGGGGYARPVWAVDPLTGTDLDWATDLTFQYLPVTYDLDGTRVTALLLDGDRLYIGGFFHTAEGHWSLAAVQAASGGAVGWRPSPPAPSFVVALVRVGPAIGASFIHWLGTGSWLYAFHSETAARLPFQLDVVGGVATVASAPEGVVLGGSFAASGGVDRGGLASIDLDTYAIDPWTAAIAFWPARAAIAELATDGVWLFALTEGDLGGRDARIVKIDPATGAVAGERSFPSVVTRMRVAGSQLLVSTHKPYTNAGQLGAITIADWSFTALPVTIDGVVASLDATDDTVYFGGGFSTVNGEMRRGFAAVHRVTGAVQSWQPATNADGGIVRTAGGRVWLAGVFTRVGGQSRHGLAEVDPATGAPLPWNPDVGGVLSGGSTFGGVHRVEIASDGYLYAWLGPSLVSDTWARGVAAGQLTPLVLVYSTASGSRLPWRPAVTGLVALTPDCAVAPSGCLVEAVPSPANVQVSVVDHAVTITWTLPVTPARTGVRLEVGTVENRADLLALDLPADQASFTAAAPPGRYVARVRALAGPATSLTTPDVSFAVGPPGVPGAPLDLTARRDGARVTFAWNPPSTGAPPQYDLEAGTARGQRDIGALAVAGGATSVTLTLPAGTYWTRIVAVNEAGRSAPSAEAVVDLVPRQSCRSSPPLNLAATVSNRVVTLTWDPPADGSEAPPRIVAGSVPGGSDIGTLTAPAFATTFSIAAPPGTYYVRLEVGCFVIGRSNEVQIVVP